MRSPFLSATASSKGLCYTGGSFGSWQLKSAPLSSSSFDTGLKSGQTDLFPRALTCPVSMHTGVWSTVLKFFPGLSFLAFPS